MIKIRKFKKEDIYPACDLILKTYQKFNHKKSSPKMLELHFKLYSPKRNTKDELLANFKKASIIFIAENDNKIIGIAKGKLNRLNNLYVLGSFHKKGIGSMLLKKYEQEAKKRKSKFIKIRASLFAVGFYEKMGYKKSAGKKKLKDLVYQPMKKIL